ncbi:hypothetical protein OG235_27975 [Streptomyces sp. NBC_00024]|uniref:hypothetical protein n=1 Tax=Streptomyces sp. NBC_00024 TaxID=2903612 RepID=UPI00324429AD
MALELDGRRKELCDWLTANHIEPRDVPVRGDLAVDTVDGQRVIRYEAMLHSADGRLMLDDRGEDVAIERRTVPLLVEPPDWWEPYEKPTRATLLAAVERVRALHVRNPNSVTCEHCSERDYPDYSVPWPCPTIRALDEEQP